MPLAFLAFVHELGDEGLELGHLSLEFLDAAGILGDALAVEGGLLGGVLVSVIFFLIFEQFALLPAAGYVPFTDATWKSALVYIAIGLVGALAGQLGDLAASRIKRALGIKDFGLSLIHI